MAKLIKMTPLSGESTMVMEMSFDSKQDMDNYMTKEQQDKKKAKQHIHDMLAKIVQKNGGKRTMTIAQAVKEYKVAAQTVLLCQHLMVNKWEDPGKDEVEASCNTLIKGWENLDLSKKVVILDNGKGVPTGGIHPELIKDCEQSAKLEVEQDGLLSLLAGGAQLVQLFTAINWLDYEMQGLKIQPKVRQGVNFKLGRMAATGMSSNDMWSAVLRHHHGFLKTLWEAQTFGRKDEEDDKDDDLGLCPGDRKVDQEKEPMEDESSQPSRPRRQRKQAKQNPDASDSDD